MSQATHRLILAWFAALTAVAASPQDFTVFPCTSGQCSVGQIASDASGITYVVGTRYAQTQTVYIEEIGAGGAISSVPAPSGSGGDTGRAIALDAAGNIYIAGSTNSTDFPLKNAVQSKIGLSPGGFVAKISPAGELLYSTYFGGTSSIFSVTAIAVDARGNAYLTGYTGSHDFPTTAGLPSASVTGDGPGGVIGAFFSKLSPAGALVYSGLIAGGVLTCNSGSSCFLSIRSTGGISIAVDAAGNAVAAGYANVTDLPTTAGARVPKGLGGWVARINSSGARLDYLTYLSSVTYGVANAISASSSVSAVAVDPSGNAYFTGSTSDPTFWISPGTYQSDLDNGAPLPTPPNSPATDAFVLKLDAHGQAVYCSYLGGSGNDSATAISVDETGAVYFSGRTSSSDFPAVDTVAGTRDFVAVLNPGGAKLTYAGVLPSGSASQSLAVLPGSRAAAANANGAVEFLSLNTPPSPQVFGMADAAGGGLASGVAPGEVISLYGIGLGPATGVAAALGANGLFPSVLSGTEVLFDDTPAPLLYVSQSQINVVAPFGLTPGTSVLVRVIAGGIALPDIAATVLASRPTAFGNGTSAAAINQDGSLNSLSHPAIPGSVVSIWITGAGALSPLPVDGAVATAASDYHCCAVAILGQAAEVLYAGAAPGLVNGVVQINFRVPVPASPLLTPSIPFQLTAQSAPPMPMPPGTAIFVQLSLPN